MADFGIGEAALASEVAGEVGLSTLPTSVLSAEAAFGAPAAAGLIGSGASGIAGLSGAGAMAGLGETPYLAAYSNALNAGLSIPEASQAAIQAANAATPIADQTASQIASQNLSNVSGNIGNQFANVGPGSDMGGYSQDKAILDAARNGKVVPQDDTLLNAFKEANNIQNPVTTPTDTSPFQLREAGSGQGIDSTAKLQGYRASDVGNLYKPIFDTSPTSVLKPAADTSSNGILSTLKGMMPESTLGKVGLGVGAAMAYDKLFGPKYGVPAQQSYNGPLSKFKYSPTTYSPAPNPTPVYAARRYADGGLMDGGNQGIAGLSANPNFPTANQQNPRYAVPSQMPVGAADVRMAHMAPTPMAAGGSAHSDLGGYSDGGRMLKGPGDGMSDSIPASIGGKQPARLADGEFVVPADVVSHLGNGSTDAGAKQLYKMMNKVRKARTGTTKQGKQINPKKYTPV
jgi:hypothetical protein